MGSVSRRRFLIMTGGVVGAGLVSCGGAASTLNVPSDAADFGRARFGRETGVDKVLVAYASGFGSTAEVAKEVGSRLGMRGEAVDVRPVQEVGDLSAYRAVIIGSAVRSGNVLPEAVKFVEAHRDALRKMPNAFFAVHCWNLGDDERSRRQRLAYLDSIRKTFVPQQEVFFPGKIEAERIGFAYRLAGKVMRLPDGDYRDWEAIRAWADGVRLGGTAMKPIPATV